MKKTIIFTVLMFFCIFLKAQKNDYKFKIENIQSLPEAKNATDFLRSIFNVYPTFNDSTDCFEFKSDFYINESGLKGYLNEEGYKLLYFSRIEQKAIKEEE